MILDELRTYFKTRIKHAPNCAEEYKAALEALDELEEYRKTMQSPEDIRRMQEEFFNLAVRCNEQEKQILLMNGARR